MEHAVKSDDPLLSWRKRRGKETVREVVTHTQQTDLAEDDRKAITNLIALTRHLKGEVDRCNDRLEIVEAKPGQRIEILTMIDRMTKLAEASDTQRSLILDQIDQLFARDDLQDKQIRELKDHVALLSEGPGKIRDALKLVKEGTPVERCDVVEAPQDDEPLPKILRD